MASGELSPAEAKALAHRLRNDFLFFAKKCLRIRRKDGKVVPFELNRAQRRLHDVLERQRQETGKVRAIIVKGRQMGASTYIQGRFYWRLWGGEGLRAFILTHEQPATDNLFAMAKRFHDNVPPEARPPTKSANAKELVFADNECSYAVATAGTKGIGRSATIQLFHGSEVGFWPNAEDHVDGVEQAVADADGTERLFESTANGIGNVFQRRYSAAERKASDEQAIFLPWFWDAGYEEDPPTDWEPSAKWAEYQRLHGITDAQLYWAFKKNRGMATAISASPDEPCWKFMQEYPATAAEAFQSGGDSFIPAVKVMTARRRQVSGVGPLIIGVDPGRGGDPTGVIDRCGRRMGERVCERWDDDDLMVVAGKVARLIKLHRPAMVNIDVGGLGAGVYDRLAELGYGYCVNAVNFGSAPVGVGPTGDELYANRRAEMWDVYRDWYDSPGGVQVPDDDGFQGDACAPAWGKGKTRYRSNNELILEEKDSIRDRLGFSPDLGDAAALTFAEPISPHIDEYDDEGRDDGRSGQTGY